MSEEIITHYSPAASRALTGDIHGTLACGAAHWGFVADDWNLVTCEPCKSARTVTTESTWDAARDRITETNDAVRAERERIRQRSIERIAEYVLTDRNGEAVGVTEFVADLLGEPPATMAQEGR